MKKILLIICMISFYSCKNVQGNSQQSNSTLIEETSTLIEETKELQLIPQDILDQGEVKVGKYHVSYILSYNDIIAHVYPETVELLPGTPREVRNKSLFLTVRYEGKIILNNKEIRTTNFEEIEDAGKFRLAAWDRVFDDWFSVVNDRLVVEFTAEVEDTSWGYSITLFIDKDGKISSKVVDNDDLVTEW